MLALVTGSTGFIGSHLCRALLARGHTVRAFHRPGSPLRALEGLPVERVVGDVLDPASLGPAMRRVDWVFHVAAVVAHWRDPRRLVETTVTGTRNVLVAARAAGVRRLVYTSSVAALGVPAPGEVLDERHRFNYPAARWPYGHAKHIAEDHVRGAADALDCVVVNPASVFGAVDLNLIGGQLIVSVARGRVPVTVPGGMNVVHVADVAAGHVAAAERGRRGERYILGGENLSHTAIVRVIAEEAGRRPPRLELPPALVAVAARLVDLPSALVCLPVDGNLLRLSRHRFYYDIRKAGAELGLAPPTPFRTAVRDALTWYRAHGHL